MAGAFQLNTWTTGDFLTQTKMRQHNTNEEYLKERTDMEALAYDDFEESWVTSYDPGLPGLTLLLQVDGNTVASQALATGNGTVKFADLDITTLGAAQGLRTFQILCGATGKLLRHVKGQDMDYVTLWADVAQTVEHDGGGTYTRTIGVSGISLISHSEQQYW